MYTTAIRPFLVSDFQLITIIVEAESWRPDEAMGNLDVACLTLQSCQLNSIAQPGQGSLTAQKRTGNENTGFSFVGCTITGTGPIYLGRAWGPNSRVVFIQCNIADIILPSGWYDWGVSSREKWVLDLYLPIFRNSPIDHPPATIFSLVHTYI